MNMSNSAGVRQFLARPFRLLEISLQRELALYLNMPSRVGVDWRDVAERCGFTVQEIKVRTRLK